MGLTIIVSKARFITRKLPLIVKVNIMYTRCKHNFRGEVVARGAV